MQRISELVAFLRCGLLAVPLFLSGRISAEEPVVSLGPTKLTLHPDVVQRLVLAIRNKTKRGWRFCRFYDSWSPLLMQEGGLPIQFRHARDATLPPSRNDYPLLSYGHSAKRTCGCELIRENGVLDLVIGDPTGGAFSSAEEMKPGRYKLCISYQVNMKDGMPSLFSVESIGVERGEVWPGWQMSNWIDVIIEAGDAVAK
jgi:hypothetical protein